MDALKYLKINRKKLVNFIFQGKTNEDKKEKINLFYDSVIKEIENEREFDLHWIEENLH